jgi:GNAT superfamily N-acetyltransferase
VGFLAEHCTFSVYTENQISSCTSFDCDHQDLNEFFIKDSPFYNHQLLGKTYCFILDEKPSCIVCAFTVANASIQTFMLPNSRKKKVIKDIPREKHMRSYPAVLIGRLGVSKDFSGKRIGDELMDFIKAWFIDGNNKTGCRFAVVDSYNTDRPLKYYHRNSFEFVFQNEEQEKEHLGLKPESELHTRLMFFDLITLKS